MREKVKMLSHLLYLQTGSPAVKLSFCLLPAGFSSSLFSLRSLLLVTLAGNFLCWGSKKKKRNFKKHQIIWLDKTCRCDDCSQLKQWQTRVAHLLVSVVQTLVYLESKPFPNRPRTGPWLSGPEQKTEEKNTGLNMTATVEHLRQAERRCYSTCAVVSWAKLLDKALRLPEWHNPPKTAPVQDYNSSDAAH